jgi:diguanylate cyclase (GGDEF)-like protein/PAS domain S-box-containing protein
MQRYVEDILSTLEECILVINNDYKIETVNDKVIDLFNVDRNSLIGKEFKEIFSWDTSICPLEVINDLKSGESKNIDNLEININGNTKYITGKMKAIDLEDGLGIVMTFSDNTTLTLAEKELELSEKKFKSLYNSLLSGYTLRRIIYDENRNPYDYMYLEANPAYLFLMGHTRDEVIGKTYRELYSVNDKGWLHTFHKVAVTGEPLEYEGYAEAVDRYLKVSVFKVSDDEIGVITVDTTEERKLERALKEERELFKKLFSSMQNGYAYCEIVKTNSITDFKYLEVNPAFLEISKVSYEEVIGRTSRDVFPHGRKLDESKTNNIIKLYEKAAYNGTSIRFDTFSNVMGIDIEVYIYGFGDGTFVVEYIDITDRKKLQGSLEIEKEKFSNLFSKMLDGVVLLEVEDTIDGIAFKVLEMNPACEELSGMSFEKVRGKYLKEIFSNTEYSLDRTIKTFEFLYDRAKQEGGIEAKGLYEHGFGKYLYVSAFIPEENRLAIIAKDFTKQKELEDEINKEKEQYKLLFENTLSGFALSDVIIDEKGNTLDFITRKVNPAFLELGFTSEDEIVNVLGSDFYGVKPGDWREGSIVYDYGQVVKTGKPVRKEYYTTTFKKYIDISVARAGESSIVLSYADITDRKEAEKRLSWNLDILRQSHEIAKTGSWEVNYVNNHIWLSLEARKLFDIDKEYVDISEMLEIIHPEDKRKYVKAFERSKLKNGKQIDITHRIVLKGSKKVKHIHLRGLVKISEEEFSVIGVSQDITELVKAQEELVDSEARFRKIIESTSDIVIIYDKDLVVKYRSPNMGRILGWTKKEFKSLGNFNLLHPEDVIQTQTIMKEVIEKGPGTRKQFEARVKDKHGNYRYTLNTIVNMLDDPHVNGLLINYFDITESKEREKEILHLSNHDALTGLYNRTYFENNLDDFEKEDHLPLSIIMGDLNGLKLTNDMFGHAKGDEILIAMADIIRKSCPDESVPIRFGGDEYCIILKNTTEDIAAEIIKKIKRLCNEYRESVDNELFYPSISLGYKTRKSIDQSFSDVLRSAEDMMYKEKLFESKSVHSASALIASVKAALHEKSFETEEHSNRLKEYSRAIGQHLNLGENELQQLALAAELHDIGKIGIDNSILTKETALNEKEWKIIKEHPEIGYRIAEASGELSEISEYILYHHERYDGKGYPLGKAREEIPLFSRIISVVDAFDVMTSDRPYRKKMSLEKAVLELESNKGSQFDPALVDIFVKKVIPNIKL